MDDAKAIEALTREMELTRLEMAALTDAINRLNHTMERTATETNSLATRINEASQRGLWQRLFG